MNFNKKNYSNKLLLDLYKQLLRSRLIEQKMLILLRQGKISKWFSGIGQEAVSIGAAMALNETEFLLPAHRNLGIFTSRNVPLNRLFAQFFGKKEGFTKGRDRSFHFGTKEHHIVGMISHLGPQLTVANGISLAEKLAEEKKVVLTITGEGGSSEGDFHEALNVAAVWQLPVIFLLENNGYSISTPTEEQFKISSFTEKGPAYGIETYKIDGNNILEVYNTIQKVASSMRRSPKPVLIEAITFRMRGHEESSGTEYVPKELFAQWAKKDPIENYERFLLKEKVLTEDKIDELYSQIDEEIDTALDEAFGYPETNSSIEEEIKDVYVPYDSQVSSPSGLKSNKRYIDAIREAMQQSMHRYPNLVLMGQDIAEYGGVFKATEGLVEEFGKDRVRNTPLCESAILGAGLGLAIKNYKSVVEIQFADFVTCGFNQIVNNLAKSHYRWGQSADVVIRMPSGAGISAGPFHSQSTEAWFFHTPGLKIVYPSTPSAAKGLLTAAIADPNPILFFEHKKMYRSTSEEVYDNYYETEIGKARIAQSGEEVSIITYGMGVHWALQICKELNVNADIIDLQTLLPWDKDAVSISVEKTGKALVLTEDCLTGSITAEIAAWISEHLFEKLDAPVVRVGSLDTPIPFSKNLEDDFLPIQRFKEKLQVLVNY